MRTFGTVRGAFWKQGSGKRLRGKPEAQVLALHLMTCSEGTMCGIFHISLPAIAHDTGLPIERLPALFQEISEIAQYDAAEELCWVPNSAREQLGETLSPKDKRRPSLLRELAQFKRHPFAAQFITQYEGAYGLDGRGFEGASAVGVGAGKPPVQVQVQVQDQVEGVQGEVFDLPLDEPPKTQRDIPRPLPVPTNSAPPTPPKAQPRVAQAPQSGVSATVPDWRPRTRQEALNAPIAQRASWAMRELHWAAEYAPQEWLEVLQVAQAFHAAYKLAPPKLGRLDSDKHGTQRLVSLLTQYTPEQLVKVCAALPKEKFSIDRIGAGDRPRLGWLSDEVVRTAFGALPSERPISERVRRATAHLEPMKETGS